MKYPKPSANQKIAKWTIIDPTIQKIKKSYYVECQCECGKRLLRNYHSLMRGDSTSCGCEREYSLKGIEKWKKEHGGPNKKPPGEAAFNELYNRYRTSAKSSNREFLLSKEELKIITKMNCHYCGIEPSSVLNSPVLNGGYTYNGIDRKDNLKGYTVENSLPCCTLCNFLKKDKEYQLFINHVRKISEHLNEKNSQS